MVSDRHCADDLLQEVWFRVFQALGTLRDVGAFPQWIDTIARMHAYQELRRRPERSLPFSSRHHTSEDGQNPLLNLRRMSNIQLHPMLGVFSAPEDTKYLTQSDAPSERQHREYDESNFPCHHNPSRLLPDSI